MKSKVLFFLFAFQIFHNISYSQSDTTNSKRRVYASFEPYFIYYYDNDFLEKSNKIFVGQKIILFPIRNIGIGVHYLKIFDYWKYEFVREKTYYEVYGGFLRGILYFKHTSVYWNVGYFKGNYCTCDSVPYLQEGLNYLSLGTGILFRLKNGFNLNMGFNSDNILNPLILKYANNYFRIGFTYDIRKPIKYSKYLYKRVRYL